METVVIQTTIVSFGEKQIVVEMSMWNQEKTKLKALLWTTFVHFNLATQKSEKHSPEFTRMFKPFENTEIKVVSFEKRLEEIEAKRIR